MSLIQSLLGDKFSTLTQMLTDKLNFTTPQANSFIPEAAQDFFTAYQNKGDQLDLSNISASASTLLDHLNISELATKVGLTEQQAQAGIAIIMPTLLELAEKHKDKLENIESLITNLHDSPLSGMLGGLGNKLFRSRS